jgi:hypothetical protein
MTPSDNIVEKYGSHMTSFFNQRLTEIDSEIESLIGNLMKEKNEITDILNTLQKKGKIVNTTLASAADYASATSFIEKAVLATKLAGDLTLNEIAAFIKLKEPNINVEEVKATLSAVLVMEIKKPETTRRLDRKQNKEGKWVYIAR